VNELTSIRDSTPLIGNIREYLQIQIGKKAKYTIWIIPQVVLKEET
jgi:hypothetical protein